MTSFPKVFLYLNVKAFIINLIALSRDPTHSLRICSVLLSNSSDLPSSIFYIGLSRFLVSALCVVYYSYRIEYFSFPIVLCMRYSLSSLSLSL